MSDDDQFLIVRNPIALASLPFEPKAWRVIALNAEPPLDARDVFLSLGYHQYSSAAPLPRRGYARSDMRA